MPIWFTFSDWKWKQEQSIIQPGKDNIRLPANEERKPVHDRENKAQILMLKTRMLTGKKNYFMLTLYHYMHAACIDH